MDKMQSFHFETTYADITAAQNHIMIEAFT